MNKGKFNDQKHQKPQWPGHAGRDPQKPEQNPGHNPGNSPQGNPNKPQWPGNKDKR